jgi:hypothetical protein
MDHETGTTVDARMTVDDLMIRHRAMRANDARRGVMLARMMRNHAIDYYITERWLVDRSYEILPPERVALDMEYGMYGYESAEDLVCPADREPPFLNPMRPRSWY